MESRSRAFSAHSGNATGAVFSGAKDSLPPKPWAKTGLPDVWGSSMPSTAWSRSRYLRATRFTSATVTRCIAFTSSSGDCRPSTASAWDHAIPSPDTEFFCNSAFVISSFFAASTRSAGNPFLISMPRIFRTSLANFDESAPFGNVAIAYARPDLGKVSEMKLASKAFPSGTRAYKLPRLLVRTSESTSAAA